MTRLSLIVSAALCLCVASNADARKWTDVSGKYSIEAEFVELAADQVKLRRTNGKVITVPLAKLNASAQRFVRRAAADASRESTTTNGASPDKRSDVRLTATARWSDTIHIREDNTQAPPDLEVVIEAKGASAREAVAYGLVKTKAVTASRKKLSPAESLGFEDPAKEYVKIDRDRKEFFTGQPKDGVRVTLTFENPGSKVAQVDAVEGSFKMRTGGERKVVTITDAARRKAAVSDPALKAAGVEIAVKREGANTLEVAVRGKADAIDKMQLTDPDGDEPAGFVGGGTGTINGQVFHHFQFEKKIPADVQLKITLLSGTREVEVPFKFKDLEIEN